MTVTLVCSKGTKYQAQRRRNDCKQLLFLRDRRMDVPMDVRQPKCQGRPINFCARQSSTSDNFSTCNVIVS